MMRYYKALYPYKMQIFLAMILTAFLLTGCAKPVAVPRLPPPPPAEKKATDHEKAKKHAYRTRTSPWMSESRYEGSLWKDEASWGNLLRDHRARFRGDLVKIISLTDVISVPKKKEKPEPPARGVAAAGEEEAAQITQALDIATGQYKAEEEQDEVLGSLRQISAYVKSVLPNGNMLIVGEKIDYRQQNSVRYVTTIKGIIRPSDVNDLNEVPALKLARFEAKIRRQMLSKNLRALAPLIGTQKAGLLDRLTHMATPSSTKAKPVNTQ